MAVCISTHIDVEFRDKRSCPFADYEAAIQRHFRTTSSSIESLAGIGLPKEFEPLIVCNLANHSQMCLGKPISAPASAPQQLFTFRVVLSSRSVDTNIEELLCKYEKAIMRKGEELRINQSGVYHLHATNAERVSDEEGSFTLSLKRPTLFGDLKIEFTFMCILLLLTVGSFGYGLANRVEWVINLGWAFLAALLTQILNIAYSKARKRVAISIDEIAETGNALMATSSAEAILSDMERHGADDGTLKPRGERYANALMASGGKRLSNRVIPNEDVNGGMGYE